MPRDPTPAPVAPWSERWAGLVVTALPATAALARLAHQPTWREDVAILRDVALVGMGPGGGVSTALAQVAGALPLGTLGFRAGLVSVVALAVGSRLAFAVALRLLRGAQRSAPTPLPGWLAPAFAAIAVCGAGLSPTVQLEATVAGGATVAAALVLGALALAARATDPADDGARGRDVAAAGLLIGAALAERPLASVAAVAAVGALLFTHRIAAALHQRAGDLGRGGARAIGVLARSLAPGVVPRLAGGGAVEPGARGPAPGSSPRRAPRRRLAPVPGRALVLAALLAVVSVAVVVAPSVLRPIAPHRALDLGFSSIAGAAEPALAATSLGAWRTELGWTPLALALMGAIVLAARAATRPGAAALGALVALDVVLPGPIGGGSIGDPAGALRTLAVVALAVLAAFGLHEGVARLLRARVPYARPAAILLVAFQATLVALTSEQAATVADRASQRGAEEWLDASRAALEARSVAMVGRPVKALHLWAAQLTTGFRPDVVVASSDLLPRAGMASELLAREMRSHDLVRTTALRGGPDEFALSELADARLLHVEPDRAWDERTASHVELDGVWVRFAPHPIGRTDRKRSAEDSMAPLARVLAAVDAVEAPDPATTAIVASTVREQALILARLGEADTARALAQASRRLGPTTSVGSPAAAVLLASLELTQGAARPAGPMPVKRTSLR